jgi:hypothetical protein
MDGILSLLLVGTRNAGRKEKITLSGVRVLTTNKERIPGLEADP